MKPFIGRLYFDLLCAANSSVYFEGLLIKEKKKKVQYTKMTFSFRLVYM